MKDLPYYRWFPADAIGDEKYASLNDQELGFFHRCLNHSWMNGGLPSDLDDLAASMRVNRAYLDRLWVKVGRCWHERDGRFFNRRQEEERTHAVTKSNKNSSSAAFGQDDGRGFVYLISRPEDGAIKIGSTANVSRRLAQLRYRYRSDLVMVDQFPVENMSGSEVALHQRYDSARVSGEWFKLSGKDLEEIRATLSGDMGGDNSYHPGGDRSCHPGGDTPLRAYDSDSDSESCSDSEKNKPANFHEMKRAPDSPPSEKFEAWWKIWSAVRGTNHRPQAENTYFRVVTRSNEGQCFDCTHSYLASLDRPGGYNPENFLDEQARDGFRARFPAARSRDSPGLQRLSPTKMAIQRALEREAGRNAIS